MKSFDCWNSKKKSLEIISKHRLYHQRDIWWCSLGTNIGHEQDGTGKEYDRPVLILKGFSKYVCLILPLTKSNKTSPYLSSIRLTNNKKVKVILSQIRLIDTKRLVNKIDVLDKYQFNKIRKAVRDLL